MMNLTDLIKAIKEVQDKTEPYDTQAVVEQIEDGKVWVRIPGSDTTTPVDMTVDAKEGDTVQVRVSGGTAFLTGNATAPPTDDTKATEAVGIAEGAVNVAESASEMAVIVSEIAGNTAQHFWMTEEGTDTGAHITEVTQEEFLADPENGGGNLLARSNGIAVRDGLKELAQFSADGIALGDSILISPNALVRPVWGFEALGDHSVPCTIDLTDSALFKDVLDGGTAYITWYDSPQGKNMAHIVKGQAATRQLMTWVLSYDGEKTIELVNETTGYTGTVTIELRAEVYQLGAVFSFGKRYGESGSFSASFGESLIASGDDQVVFGKYNKEDPDKALIIGNGSVTSSSDSRSNAFAVGWDGTVETANGELIPQTSTTWTAPTILNSSCTISGGGYYTEGKRVYIQMRLTLTANLADNAGINILSDLPVPDTVNAVPLSILANNRGGHGARITNAGQLQIIADIDHGITAGQNIDLSGVYTIS